MKHTGTSYNNYAFVLLTTISLCFSLGVARGEVASLQENYGPQENRPYDKARFHYSKKTTTNLSKFYGQLDKNIFGNKETDLVAEMNMEYAHLFSSSNGGYSGFSYLSAKLDNDNKIKFNSSLGHFVGALDGELFFSYRLLGDNRNYTLPSIGNIGTRVYENSFSANYTRYSDSLLRETLFSYNYSTIPGQEFYETAQPFQTTIVGGYGNTTSHEIEAQMAFGYEELRYNLITGLRTSFGLGYEYVLQDALYNYSDLTDASVSLLAAIEHKTPYGLVSTSFKHLESSQTLYAGYSLEGIELYIKETKYQDKKDNRLLGFLIKFDLFNPKDPFRKIKNLFRKNNSTNRGQEQIRHSMSLKSDSFLNQPVVKSFIDS
jgi:hypothetical protein